MDAATEHPANRWVKRFVLTILALFLLAAIYSLGYLHFRTDDRTRHQNTTVLIVGSKQITVTQWRILLDRSSRYDTIFYYLYQPAIWIDYQLTGIGYDFN